MRHTTHTTTPPGNRPPHGAHLAPTQHHPAFRPASAFDTRRDEITTGCSDTLPRTPSPTPISTRPSEHLTDMGTRRTQLQMDPSIPGQHDRNAIGVPEPTGSCSVPVQGTPYLYLAEPAGTTFLYPCTWESVGPGFAFCATQHQSISSRTFRPLLVFTPGQPATLSIASPQVPYIY